MLGDLKMRSDQPVALTLCLVTLMFSLVGCDAPDPSRRVEASPDSESDSGASSEKRESNRPETASASTKEVAPPGSREPGHYRLEVGKQTLFVEIADTPSARNRGLMGRSEIPDDYGMLFVFAQPGYQRFWMKNCLVPIDIAFIDEDFKVTDIHTMRVEPAGTRHWPPYRSTERVLYALEARAGWFEEHKIEVGETIELSEVLKNANPR